MRALRNHRICCSIDCYIHCRWILRINQPAIIVISNAWTTCLVPEWCKMMWTWGRLDKHGSRLKAASWAHGIKSEVSLKFSQVILSQKWSRANCCWQSEPSLSWGQVQEGGRVIIGLSILGYGKHGPDIRDIIVHFWEKIICQITSSLFSFIIRLAHSLDILSVYQS